LRELQRTVLHVAESDKIGGAARAMYSIHEALGELGWTSRAVVGRKVSFDTNVLSYRSPSGRALSLVSKFIDQQVLRVVGRRTDEPVTLNLLGSPVGKVVDSVNPSIVHLHWVGNSFITPRSIAALPDPTVWTLWDMWPFTGGCHYSWGCERHSESCGHCPIIGSSRSLDATRLGMLRKSYAWRRKTFHVVAVSEWLASQARRSRLFARCNIDVILPGVDTFRFRPHDPAVAREILGLPRDRSIIGFVAINPGSPRKGWKYLYEALQILRNQLPTDRPAPLLLRVGAVTNKQRRACNGLETVDLGFLEDDLSLGLAYSACSVVAVPSTQEAFGRVAIEALACGTPVVAFRGTGVADAVHHGHTGYLAEQGSADDLARGLTACIEGMGMQGSLRDVARESALKEFSTTVQAARYAALYERLLADHLIERRG
jgi:glycosyltransferase involved in cell wall biosynthesis